MLRKKSSDSHHETLLTVEILRNELQDFATMQLATKLDVACEKMRLQSLEVLQQALDSRKGAAAATEGASIQRPGDAHRSSIEPEPSNGWNTFSNWYDPNRGWDIPTRERSCEDLDIEALATARPTYSIPTRPLKAPDPSIPKAAEAPDASGMSGAGVALLSTSINRPPLSKDHDPESLPKENTLQSHTLSKENTLTQEGLALIDKHKNTVMSMESMDLESEPEYELTCLEAIVFNKWYDIVVWACVTLNALSIGFKTDWEARHLGMAPNYIFRVADIAFLCFFLCELGLRFYVFGSTFFTMTSWQWNVFDCAIVATQAFDVVDPRRLSGGVLRGFRVIRLIRVARVMRLLRALDEVRKIAASIVGSMKALFWVLGCCLIVMYMVGVFLTQIVMDLREDLLDGGGENEDIESLTFWCGNVPRSMLMLYETTSGGFSYDEFLHPLFSQTPLWPGLLFFFYHFWFLFAVMNVVTGVFMEKALFQAEKEKHESIARSLFSLFAVRGNSGGDPIEVTWQMFESKLECPEMVDYFKSINVDTADARSLFDLLDSDLTGDLDCDELVSGCLCLHGQAKALDLALFKRDYLTISRHLLEKLEAITAAQTQLLCDRADLEDRPQAVAALDMLKHASCNEHEIEGIFHRPNLQRPALDTVIPGPVNAAKGEERSRSSMRFSSARRSSARFSAWDDEGRSSTMVVQAAEHNGTHEGRGQSLREAVRSVQRFSVLEDL